MWASEDECYKPRSFQLPPAVTEPGRTLDIPWGGQRHSWQVSLSGGNRVLLLLPEQGDCGLGMLRAPGASHGPLPASRGRSGWEPAPSPGFSGRV